MIYECDSCDWIGDENQVNTIKSTNVETCPECSEVIKPVTVEYYKERMKYLQFLENEYCNS